MLSHSQIQWLYLLAWVGASCLLIATVSLVAMLAFQVATHRAANRRQRAIWLAELIGVIGSPPARADEVGTSRDPRVAAAAAFAEEWAAGSATSSELDRMIPTIRTLLLEPELAALVRSVRFRPAVGVFHDEHLATLHRFWLQFIAPPGTDRQPVSGIQSSTDAA